MAASVVYEWLVVMFYASVSVCGSERALQMVHVVYRHGNRSPMHSYPTDPYTSSDWPQGLQQLSASGKLQHYLLGQWLQKRYATNDKFLNSTYLRNEIYVRSTDIDRTLMSAECNLAGFYPPNGKQKWSSNNKLPWQPIPIHTVAEADDKVLGFSSCPKLKKDIESLMNSDVFKTYCEKNKDFMDFVRNRTGLVNGTFHDLQHVADAVWFERVDNKTLPSWINDTVFGKLIDLINFGYTINHNASNVEMTRLFGGCCTSDPSGCCTSDPSGCCTSDPSGCCKSDPSGCCTFDFLDCCTSDPSVCCTSDPSVCCTSDQSVFCVSKLSNCCTSDHQTAAHLTRQTAAHHPSDCCILVDEITKHMVSKAEAPQNATYKMYMYSGHDTTMASVMAAVGVFNDLWPPTASCLMVELYKETGKKRERRHGGHEKIEIPVFNGTYTIDVYYYNNTQREPYQLQITGCDKSCPLEDFLKLSSKVRLTEEEWTEECGGETGIHPHSHGTIIDYWDLHFNIGSIIAGIALIFVMILFVVLCCGVLIDPLKGKRKRQSLDSMEL
uniref:acid phosphatase n=1 Tax=Saccoglossus kowalevskii TaxID=10224 RepID=A0ABM0GTX3_SACKO|nr:PREDICTED: lysosomal acid phosphatase-like [Saccoglossus kowalevskii]